MVQALRKLLPNENIIYIADSANAPYGDNSQDFIQQRCLALTDQLIKQNVKAIVVACNTATVSSIAMLREKYDLPIIGVEPGIKPAVASSQSKTVGVLATTQTLQSESFKRLVNAVSGNVNVVLQACPGLMEKVESLEFTDDNTELLVKKYVQPLVSAGADSIALGCTHYVFLLPLIQRVAGPTIYIVNTAAAVAKEVVRRLTDAGLLSLNGAAGEISLLTTGSKPKLNKQFDVLMVQQ